MLEPCHVLGPSMFPMFEPCHVLLLKLYNSLFCCFLLFGVSLCEVSGLLLAFQQVRNLYAYSIPFLSLEHLSVLRERRFHTAKFVFTDF
jgi:hypothetical protein